MTDRQTERIALERIRLLFGFADEAFPHDPELAQRYVDLARKIAMRTRLHLPRDLRRRVCRRCKSFLVPGANSRVRIRQHREPHIAVSCFSCGEITRIPIRSRKL